MTKTTFWSLVIVTILILGAAYGGYQYGRRSARTQMRILRLPGQVIEKPGKIITKPMAVLVADSAAIASREDSIRKLRGERDFALARLARYEETWAEVDTTFQQTAEIVTPGDTLIDRQIIDLRMIVRYGYLPINRFVFEYPDNTFKIKVPAYAPPPPPSPEVGFFAGIFDTIHDALAWFGGASLAGIIVYALVAL